MAMFTIEDLESQMENVSWCDDELRGQCPLCESSTGFAATENGKLMVYCHSCKGSFKDFITYFRNNFTAGAASNITARENTQKADPDEVLDKIANIWRTSGEADPDHPYLKRKKVLPYGIRKNQYENLLIPLINIDGDLTGIQRILPKKTDRGTDKFMVKGSKKKGSFFILNDEKPDQFGTVFIAEGYATAATIYEATEQTTIMAVDAGNLEIVGKALREKFPKMEIVYCADNDRLKQENKGLNAAKKAASETSGGVAVPLFEDNDSTGTDFNDLAIEEGIEVVKEQVESALEELKIEQKNTCNASNAGLMPPPPIEVFPDDIQMLIIRAVNNFGTTPEIVLSAMLAISSGLIGRRRLLEAKDDWSIHAALYWLVVARTGDAKSPAINWFMNPVEAIEQRLLDHYKKELEVYEGQLDSRKRGDEIPREPIRQQIKFGDITIEQKASALENNPGGVIEYRDEASGFLGDQDKYHGAKGSDRSKHLEIYDRRPLQVDRKGGAPVYVAEPSLARFGGTQPKILLDSFSDQDAAAGILGRFICVHSKQNKPALWSEQTMTKEDSSLWSSLVERFSNYDMPEDTNGRCHGREITVSKDAMDIYIEYFNELAALPYVDGSAIREILPKAQEHCLRLCLILHCMEHGVAGTSETTPVTTETMEKAITLARWVYAHNVKTWKMVVGSINNPDRQPIEKRIAQAILDLENEIEGGVLPTSKITDQVNKGYPKKFQLSSSSVGKNCSSKLGLQKNSDTSKRGWLVEPDTLKRLKNDYNLSASALSAVSACESREKEEAEQALQAHQALNSDLENEKFADSGESLENVHGD